MAFRELKQKRSLHASKIAKVLITLTLGMGLWGCATPRSVPPPMLRGFRWPLESVHVTSLYGQRGKDFHEGLDLRASTGTPVYASQSGVVLYAGHQIRGYGKLVVLRHPGKVATLYAHNSKILVRHGQQVRQGQKICISGATGHVSGPHVHFEIRKGLSPLNPLPLLPVVAKLPPSTVKSKKKSRMKSLKRFVRRRSNPRTRVYARLVSTKSSNHSRANRKISRAQGQQNFHLRDSDT